MHFDCDQSFFQPLSGIPDRLGHIESSPKTGGSAIHNSGACCQFRVFFVGYL